MDLFCVCICSLSRPALSPRSGARGGAQVGEGQLVAVPTPWGAHCADRSVWLGFPGRGQEVLQVGTGWGGFGFDLVVRW